MNPHRSFNVWFVLHWMQWLLAVLSVLCVFLPDSRLLRMADTHGWRLILLIVALYTGWSFLTKRFATFVLAIRLRRWVLATPWKEAIKSSAMRCLVGNWHYSHIEKEVRAIADQRIEQMRRRQQAEADRQREATAIRAAEERAHEQLAVRRNRVTTHAVEHGFGAEAASAFVAQLTNNAHDDARLISRITRAGQIIGRASTMDMAPVSREVLVSQVTVFLTAPDADLEAINRYINQMRQLTDFRLTTGEWDAIGDLHAGANGIVDLAPIIRTVEKRIARGRDRAQRLAQLTALQARYSVLSRPVQIGIEPLLNATCAAVDANQRTFRVALHKLEEALNAADSSHASFD